MRAEYHIPVLLHDCIEALQIRPDGTYIDATFGGGGHSKEILKRLSGGQLFAFDVDPDAASNSISDERFTLVPSNFRHLKKAMAAYGVNTVDGILADLGVSSHQFDTAERGFSTRFDGPLDMRMNKQSGPTAGEILRNSSEAALKKILGEYGELRNAGRVARRITENRERIHSAADLKEVLSGLADKGKENQFMAQVFQALRIDVNDELNALRELLMQGCEMLNPGGRMVILSYHSLEDRLVKNFFRDGNFEGIPVKDFYGNTLAPMRPVLRKPLVPGEAEIQQNNRARSAKMRVAEKINESSGPVAVRSKNL